MKKLTYFMASIAIAGLVTAGVVFADNVTNNVDASVDATLENINLTVGGSTGSNTYSIIPTNGDGKNGCNLTGSTVLTVSVNSSNTSVATVSTSSLTFTSCGDTKTITINPVSAGSSNITLTQTANTTSGTFNLATASFTVTVTGPADVTPPTLTLPADITVSTTSLSGMTVDFSATATDTAPTNPAVNCSPASGSLFALGTTTVTCTATDTASNTATGTFKVIVNQIIVPPADTTPPSLSLPADITVETSSPDGVAVEFTATATDDDPANPAVNCSPASGSVFPLGTTTVECSATDTANNTSTGTFNVTVNQIIPPTPESPSCVAFTANPFNINVGASSTLSWELSNASSAQISGIGNISVPTGSIVVFPATTTIYELIATGAGEATTTCSLAVTVTEDSGEPEPEPEPASNATSTISGTKFNDLNGNGLRDEGENGLSSWIMYAAKLVDSLTVDSVSSTTFSSALTPGAKYLLRARGTYDANDNVTADAKFGVKSPSTIWRDTVQGFEGFGSTLFELFVNNTPVPWGSFNSQHTYFYATTSASVSPFQFSIYDLEGGSDNTGSLDVDVYKVIAETLTDEGGNYSLELSPETSGNIEIAENTQEGWTETTPMPDGLHEVSITPSTTATVITGKDFGNTEASTSTSDIDPTTPPTVSIGVGNSNSPENPGTDGDGPEGPNHDGTYSGTIGVFATVEDDDLSSYHFRVVKDGSGFNSDCEDIFDSSNQGYGKCGFAYNQATSTTESFSNTLIANIDTTLLGGNGDYWLTLGATDALENRTADGEILDPRVRIHVNNVSTSSNATSSEEGGGSQGNGGGSEEPTTPTTTPGISGIPGIFLPQPGAVGLVLGASTSTDESSTNSEANPENCVAFITSYLGKGKHNNIDDVKHLQEFLNKYLGLNIPLTGFFGDLTFNAVKQFQLKEWEEILKPWVPFGLETPKTPTGYVYKTTLRRINMLNCASLNIPQPQLP